MSRINAGQDGGKGHLSVPSDKSVTQHPKCDDCSVHIHTSPVVSPSTCATHPEPCGAKTDISCKSSTLPNGLDAPSSSFTSSGNVATRTIYSIRNVEEDPEEDRPGFFDYIPCHSDHVKSSVTSRSEDVIVGTKTKSPTPDSAHKTKSLTPGSAHKTKSPTSDSARKTKSPIPDLAQTTKSPTSDSAHNTKSPTPDSAHKTKNVIFDSVYSKTSGTQKAGHLINNDNSLPSRDAAKHVSKHLHNHPHSSLMHTRKHSDGDSDGEDEEESCGSSSFSRTYCSQVDEAISYNLIPSSGVGLGSTTHRFTDFYNLYRNPHFSEVWREKERKTGARDDSDKPDLTSLVDVNGNRRLLDPVTYLQMRQFPGDRSELVSPGGLIGHHPTISISHSHGGPSSSSSVDFDRRKERRRLKLERLKGKPAEEYKDYRKFKDIKEILEFVEGSKASFKAEGKIHRNKPERGGRKKELHLYGPLEAESCPRGDDTESGNNIPTLISNSQTMGNSFGRTLAESYSKTRAAEDDPDKSQRSDFHTCLDSLSSELVITDKENAVISLGLQKSGEKIKKVGDATKSIPKPIEDDDAGADFHKSVTNCDESVNKKVQKNKHRKERLENSVDRSPKSNVIKTSESLELEDVFLQTSIHSAGREFDVYEPERESTPDQKQDFFTEVKKKKKRAGPSKDFHAGAPVNHIPNNHLQNKRSLSRSSKYRPHTLPLTHSGNVISSVDDSFSYIPVNRQIRLPRDLSPSSFPVLSGHNPLTLRAEARRNSCGDLNSESVDNKVYDSDQESAKSLPDACGVGETPTFPVSYARIAAATPRKSDTADSPSFESGVSSWSQKSSMNSSTTQTLSSCTDFAAPQSPPGCTAAAPERKATVWKGSPRERRHSIGSSPDDKVDTEKPSIAQSSRQCGSQEVISKFMTSSIAASKDGVTPTAPLVLKQDTQDSSLQSGRDEVIKPAATISDTQESPDPSLATKFVSEKRGYVDYPLHEAESVSNHSHSTFTITASAQANVLSSITQASSSSFSSSNTLGKFKVDQNGASTAISVQHFSESSITQMSSSSSRTHRKIKPSTTSTAINIRPASESSKHATRFVSNSTQKISKTKSVIFLDKRFNASPPRDFGITFGFDSSFETPSDQPSLSSRDQSKHSARSQPSQPAAASLPTQPSVPNPGASSQGISNIPSSSETANAQTLPNIPSCEFSDTSRSHLKKVLHYPGPPNGLIMASVFSGNGPATSSVLSGNGPATSSVLSGNGPATSSVRSGNGPATSSVLSGNGPATSSVCSGNGPATSSVLSGNGPATSSVLSGNGPATSSGNGLVIQREPNRSSVGSNIETASSDFVSDATRTYCVVEYSDNLSISSQKNLSQGSPEPEVLSLSAVSSCALPQGNNKSSVCDLVVNVSSNIQTSSLRCTDSSKQTVPLLAETVPCVEFLDASHSEQKAPESSELERDCKSNLQSGESNVQGNPSQINSLERNSESYASKSEAKGLIAQAADDNTSSAQQPKNLPEVLPFSVVYGLKIKPGTGCGKLLFIPSDTLKNRGNRTDVASFLRKRWSEHVLHKKCSSMFQTYTED